MKNTPKFDIKLSFTRRSLKGNKKHIENSVLLEKLLNKKINIHLKINLDKLEQEYNKKKILSQKSKTNKELELEHDLSINNLIDVSKESADNKEKKIPILKLECNKINFLKTPFLKISRSVSNQKMKNIIFKRNTLVLDLDETLVYVSDTKNNYLNLPQIQFEYYIFDESEQFIKENFNKLGIKKIKKAISFLTIRPGFSHFINIIKKFYGQIVVFTSSQYSYAEEIIKIIDKEKIISKIYSRKDCSFYNDIFYKDLSKIKDDLSHIIILDNFPESYLFQHFNGIPIPSFTGESNDNELLKLIPILEKLSKVKDVRNYIKQIIDFDEQKINFDRAYQLLNIKKKTVCSREKENINKNNSINNNKTIDSNPNFKKKKNIKLSDFDFNIETNGKTIGKNIENDNKEEKILVNDPNSYFYIEKKNIASSNRNKSNKKNNIIFLSNNYNKINIINNKKDKNIFFSKTKINKSRSKENGYKLLKPQVNENITFNNSHNIIYKNNNKNNNKMKKGNSILIDKSINTLSINMDNNIINKNQNISYLKNEDESFFSDRSRINSSKYIKNYLANNKTLYNNNIYYNNIPSNIYSYTKKSKINNSIESKKKSLFSISEIFEKNNKILKTKNNNLI